MADATPSFADFIKETRERKKKETLAQEILGSRGRKANGAGSISNTRNSSQKPSLASRMSSSSGVTKARSSSAKPSPNIDGKWQHDLHKLNNPQGPPNKKPLNRTVSASQVDRNTRAFDKFRTVLQKSAPNPQPSGFSIKGVATGGPITVIGSNFASGTTAADIEAVMAPVVAEGDGEILSCKVISAKPTVIVELSIDKRGAAQNLCDIFNGQRADGKLLYVYIKETPNAGLAHGRPSGRAGQSSFDDMDLDANAGARSESFQDGRYGFGENNRREPPRGPRKRF